MEAHKKPNSKKKKILVKNNRAGGITLLDVGLQCKFTVIKDCDTGTKTKNIDS